MRKTAQISVIKIFLQNQKTNRIYRNSSTQIKIPLGNVSTLTGKHLNKSLLFKLTWVFGLTS